MNPSPAPARFNFDLDLAAPVRKARMVSEPELDAAVAIARQQGFDEGFRQARASVETRTADSLAGAADMLAAQAAQALAMADARALEHLREAVTLSATIAKKLAGHLVARQPETELVALIAESLASLETAPHLVVRCHPDLCDALRDAAQERIKTSGFNGRLIVMGDPEIGLGDGRLEWADGGLVRDMDALSAEIDTRISAYLAARTGAPNNGD